MKKKPVIRIYLSDYFGVDPKVVEEYGAFNISLINDLPLFIDPFLLFHSDREDYKELHKGIIRYVTFLRTKAGVALPSGALKAWFYFREVKQTWLGFSRVGNAGRGLAKGFASNLSRNLHLLFADFGSESVTQGSHLEKLCLIDDGVGRDMISDFTTNLIKRHLLVYTQAFARKHLASSQRKRVAVPKVSFNYETETWQSESFELPHWGGDYVILTPRDLLTKEETWINRAGMFDEFGDIVAAVSNDQLRMQLSNYFASLLPKPNPRRRKQKKPTKKQIAEAIQETIRRFPEVIDYYIRLKEDTGDKATATSDARVKEAEETFIRRITELVVQLNDDTDFYEKIPDTLEEARARVNFLKDAIEHKDGYRVFYGLDGKPLRREEVVQLLFRLTWHATDADVNREPNNGRGPVDFKISKGAKDSTLVEFKLASNKQLEQNLRRQVEIYKKANDTDKALKVIVAFSSSEIARAEKIIKNVGLKGSPDVILINANPTKKVSASKAK
jgi:hypothetical protein